MKDLQGWAKRVVANLPVPDGLDRADLQQEAAVVALENAPRYDPTRGASLETFAGHRARGHCLDLLRVASRQVRVPLPDDVPAPTNPYIREAEREAAEQQAAALVEALNKEINRYKRALRQIEIGRRVIALVDLRYEPMEAAARAAGVSPVVAKRARAAAIELLRLMNAQ